MTITILKRAWVRDATVPAGIPAPGRIACPCGNAPLSDYAPTQPDIECPCGIRYRWDGFILNREED